MSNQIVNSCECAGNHHDTECIFDEYYQDISQDISAEDIYINGGNNRSSTCCVCGLYNDSQYIGFNKCYLCRELISFKQLHANFSCKICLGNAYYSGKPQSQISAFIPRCIDICKFMRKSRICSCCNRQNVFGRTGDSLTCHDCTIKIIELLKLARLPNKANTIITTLPNEIFKHICSYLTGK